MAAFPADMSFTFLSDSTAVLDTVSDYRLEELVGCYRGRAYAPEDISFAKKDRAEVNKIEKELASGELIDLTPGLFQRRMLYWHRFAPESRMMRKVTDALLDYGHKVLRQD